MENTINLIIIAVCIGIAISVILLILVIRFLFLVPSELGRIANALEEMLDSQTE